MPLAEPPPHHRRVPDPALVAHVVATTSLTPGEAARVVEDVIAFIENKGKNCLCCGCWKCYTNACAAQKAFDKARKNGSR